MAAVAALNLPLFVAQAAPEPLVATTVPLNLWLHTDYSMSMAGNGQETTPIDSLTTLRTWSMADGLQKDLCIDGVDIGSGRQGFQVELQVAWGRFGGGTQDLAMTLKDDATVIANGTFALTGNPGTNTFWNLNFTAARTGCTVLRGHRLALDVVVTHAGAGSGSATIGNIRNAHLAFKATDALLPTAHTENHGGPATTFYPNDIDGSREVIVNGTLGNAFTDVFVLAVHITVKDPAGNAAVGNTTGIVTGGNWTFTWSYPRSTAGAYTVEVQVEDAQGHYYNTTTSFTFAAYGLRINTQGAADGAASRYTTQGQCAAYDLTVTNIGGSATGVTMVTETTPPAFWHTNFTRPTLSLEPDASDVTTFNVCPDASVGPGNSSQITVVARSNDDPAAIKARAQLATTTVLEREIFLIIAPPSTSANVKLAGVASYNFTITNNGGLPTDVMFNATPGTSGWDRVLSAVPPLVEEASGWRLPGLSAGGTATVTLSVQAPVSATPDTTFVCTVTARSVENASAVATFVGTTRLVLGIELTQTSPPSPSQAEAGPAGFIDFQFEATNTDPLADHMVGPDDVTVAEVGSPGFIDGVDGGSITVAAPVGCCAAGTAQVIGVTVQLPTHAKAGRYTLTLFVMYDNDENKVAFLNFTLQVTQVTDYFIRLTGDPSQVQLDGVKPTHIAGYLVSESNYDLSVDVTYTIMKAGSEDPTWTIRLLGAGDVEMSSRVKLVAYHEVPINISVSASPSAWNGEHRDLAFSMAISLSGAHPVSLEPPVDLVVHIDEATVFARMWQQSLFIVLLFVGLALGAAGMARTAARGRKPPTAPPPPSPPAKKPTAPDKPGAPKSAAGPPKA